MNMRGLIALLMTLLLAACATSASSPVPAGQAAYAAIAVPADQAVPSTYLLHFGDTVSVMVFGEPDLTQSRVVIDGSGNLSLPLIGKIRAAGFSADQVAEAVTRAYGANYLRNPRVSVLLNEGIAPTVSVEGQVEQPGVYPLAPGQTLLTAIAQARSTTKTAKLDQVLIFRTLAGQRLAGRFDLQAIRDGRSSDPQMAAGDVVVVGYSSLKGAYRDVLQAVPLLALFVRF
ncbi:MAG: polysaccharide biosynthesis/export family protein [Novosphingobium sp.]